MTKLLSRQNFLRKCSVFEIPHILRTQ
uniref:Uncharacterized protein n=1 Tax=Anguilla anguilla TaxID=7936 RepID=A0A0E9UQ39_ANGAN